MGVQAKKKEKTAIADDAMDLAMLIYDLYKEEKANAKITKGQNNAKDAKE